MELSLLKLNLPFYKFRFARTQDGSEMIFDSFRKKYVALTPEEWVRQNFLQYLVNEKGFKSGRISVECPIKVKNLGRRCDAIVYDGAGKALAIVECKAPTVKISQDTFDQIGIYNYGIMAQYLIVTNGLNHFCCNVDFEKRNLTFLEEVPQYSDM